METPSDMQPAHTSSFSATSALNLPLPPLCTKHTTSKMGYLYEITQLHTTADLTKDTPMILNPYHAFKKSKANTLTPSIRTFVSPRHNVIKEYVQSSSLSQHPLSSTTEEQYITLEIPPDFFHYLEYSGLHPPSYWSRQTCTIL